MKIVDVMTRGAVVVAPESSLYEAAKLMRDHDIGAVPVVENGMHIVGMLSDRDIVIRAIAENDPELPVRKVMSKAVCCVEPDEDVKVAAEMMGREQIRRLPVVRNGELMGIVSLGDLAVEEKLERRAGEILANVSEPIKPLH